LYCLSLDLRFWLPLWYFFFNTIVLSVPWFTASDYLFGTFSLIPLYRDRKIFPPQKRKTIRFIIFVNGFRYAIAILLNAVLI
jgi:hypothetical protein